MEALLIISLIILTPILIICLGIRNINKNIKKCSIYGHDFYPIRVKIRKKGGGFRHVVTDYMATMQKCRRCGYAPDEVTDEKEVDYFTSCSMPQRMWDEIREKGFTVL